MATASGSSEIVILTEVVRNKKRIPTRRYFFLIIITQVREQYVRYLERQLQENVCVWAGASRNHHKPTAWACIAHSVKALETHAIKACQAAQLYQRAMVKMVNCVE